MLYQKFTLYLFSHKFLRSNVLSHTSYLLNKILPVPHIATVNVFQSLLHLCNGWFCRKVSSLVPIPTLLIASLKILLLPLIHLLRLTRLLLATLPMNEQ